MTDGSTAAGGNGSVDVPQEQRIQSNCVLTVLPASVNFGQVHMDASVAASVAVKNIGSDSCNITGIAIAPGSDSQFSLGPGQVDSFMLAPDGTQAISLSFHAVDSAAPHDRVGQLVFVSTDPNRATVSIPLSADIDIGCALIVSPGSLNFGDVMLNTTASATVTVSNDGGDACQVSGVKIDTSSNPDFTLGTGQANAFTVASGASQAITIQFGAFDSAPPHQETGTLVLQTGDPRTPQASVPLSATVSTVCIEASQWIYTVDTNGVFSRFDPTTLTFTDISVLSCPTNYSPNSMAVDQNAVAWVAYGDGNLFEVNTSTGHCQATSFKPDQDGLMYFGMGFVYEPSTGVDTLYIAGGSSPNGSSGKSLATVSFPSLLVTPVAPISAGQMELTGTGDGGLWGFIPGCASSTGQSMLLQIDPTSGATLASYSYPTLARFGSAACAGNQTWAMKFWGGSFWIFVNTSIYKVSRATPDVINMVVQNSDRYIVGAGVSTCAPLQ